MLFSWFFIYKLWNLYTLCLIVIEMIYRLLQSSYATTGIWKYIIHVKSLIHRIKQSNLFEYIYLLLAMLRYGWRSPHWTNIFVRFNCKNSWKYEYLYTRKIFLISQISARRWIHLNLNMSVANPVSRYRYRLSSTAWIIRSWTKVGFVSSLGTHYAFSNTLQHYCLNATRRWPYR